MAVFYLDTSALVKRYRTEKGTDVVNELYEGRVPGEVLITSQFSCLEFEAAATRALKGNRLSQDAYNAMLGSFAHDLSRALELIEVNGRRVNIAIEVTRAFALRAGDALQLASAYEPGAPDERCCFVCSDRELLDAAAAFPLRALDPEADDALERLRELRRGK